MQLLLKKLSHILNRQVTQYNRLLELLSCERQTIVSDNPEELNELVKHQGTLILELKALEEARLALMDKIAAQFRINAGSLTLSRLSMLVDEPYSLEYRRVGRQLSGIMNRIEAMNKNNAYLIDRTLDYVNGALRIFTAPDILARGYSALNKFGRQTIQGRLLCEMA